MIGSAAALGPATVLYWAAALKGEEERGGTEPARRVGEVGRRCGLIGEPVPRLDMGSGERALKRDAAGFPDEPPI
jgi:hypothetical protein